MADIGLRYEDYRKSLVEKIRNGDIEIDEIKAGTTLEKYACEFCKKTIAGNIKVLRDCNEGSPFNGLESFADEFCYTQIRMQGYVHDASSKTNRQRNL